MSAFTAFAAGLVFGIGLLVSGMANPAKVLGFLDIAGRWDPSLIVVMVTAIPIAAIAYRRKSTLSGAALNLPAVRGIDRRLVAGAIAFGAGWGLAGFCPAPAIVAVGAGRVQAVVFIIALLAGMSLFELFERVRVHRANALAEEDA